MILVVGENSEIGSATARLIRRDGGKVLGTTRRAVTAPDQIKLDFSCPMGDFAVPEEVTCACIFVAVARMAACDADPARSALINVERTTALIDLLAARGIYTLLLSSNQVFNGERSHVPADAPFSPLSEYGRQKAQVEHMLKARMASGAPIGVLRLAKVVSPGMALISGWTRELASGRPIRAFSDMVMAPTPVDMVARTIINMINERAPVVAQLTGPRDVSYAEVALLVAQRIGADSGLIETVLASENGMPIGSTPRNTTLDSSYVAERYHLRVADAFEVIATL